MPLLRPRLRRGMCLRQCTCTGGGVALRSRIAPGILSGSALLASLACAEIAAAQSSATEVAARRTCQQQEARAFDFWIGEWNVVNRNRPEDDAQFAVTGNATDRVYPVVGGCGIVEHWRGDAFGSFIVGFSVRAYDPDTRDWHLVLLWPITGPSSFLELRGSFHHERGEFFTRRVRSAGDTALTRFTFSDASPTSLRWDNATSLDGGITWSGNWIMDFTRRDATAEAGLLNGPTMTVGRCPTAEHRFFDRYLGEWTGHRTNAAGDSVAVRAHFVRILEGCAIMERAASIDGTWESFRVRAWDGTLNRWVEYEMTSERPTLLRREAVAAEHIVFEPVTSRHGLYSRTRWTPGEDDTPGWTTEVAIQPAGPWRVEAVVRLDRAVAEVP